MSDISEFQAKAASLALTKLLYGSKNFSICDLNSIAKTVGRQTSLAGSDYAALQCLHCIDWADMPPDVAEMAREKCFEILGLPPSSIPSTARDVTPSKKLSLRFWDKS